MGAAADFAYACASARASLYRLIYDAVCLCVVLVCAIACAFTAAPRSIRCVGVEYTLPIRDISLRVCMRIYAYHTYSCYAACKVMDVDTPVYAHANMKIRIACV